MDRTKSIDGASRCFVAAVITVALIAAAAIARVLSAGSRSAADQFAALICADRLEPASFPGE